MTELKLEDLRVHETGILSRRATLADLLVVLQQHGGEVRWWTPHGGTLIRHRGHLWSDSGPEIDGLKSPVDRDGKWVLVVELPDEESGQSEAERSHIIDEHKTSEGER